MIYVIAGEASGDLHGSNLIKSIKQKDNSIQIRAWGGPLMQDAGAEMVVDYRKIAFMGFVDVLLHLRTITRHLSFCKKDLEKHRPRVLILIDYPGFNLRIAKWAKNQGITVVYYITPQIWAWHQSRVHNIVKYTDERFVILPFEADFFRSFGYNATFVGHPLLDAIEQKFDSIPVIIREKPILALLPGSRRREINTMLPIMIEATRNQPYSVILAAASSQPLTFYQNILDTHRGHHIEIIYNQTYSILKSASMAIVTSGTATLETAIFKVPQIVCYKAGVLSYILAKNLIKTKYISLVNLIMDEEIVPELIQHQCTPENIKIHLTKVVHAKDQIQEKYHTLYHKLGNAGASDLVAGSVINIIKNGTP
ncbi:MAG: lipid-A-disaccharide synthase [Saprospiraceae bacterium]